MFDVNSVKPGSCPLSTEAKPPQHESLFRFLERISRALNFPVQKFPSLSRMWLKGKGEGIFRFACWKKAQQTRRKVLGTRRVGE
jgi:hypothetical protein